MNTSQECNSISLLQDRAKMFSHVRSFFSPKNVLEVDCPALGKAAPVDTHIDVMTVNLKGGETGYLHTSPEYGMKRLLAEQIGDIYQMSHVFRDGESGPVHNPEFMMVEWYRLHIPFSDFIEETLDFIRLFLTDLPSDAISYRDALKKYAKIDYLHASDEELLQCARAHSLELPRDANTWDRDTLLQLLMSFLVEPHLGQGILSVLLDYPASQAALSQTKWKGDEHVAERFEIYCKGIELANGYHELTDPVEQRRRLQKANAERHQLGKETLPIDEDFINALEKGLPDCCGVAVGFDRLMLLRHNRKDLQEILP